MKTNIKIFAMLLVTGMLAISSCTKDDKTEPLTQEEAKTVLTSAGKEMETTMMEVMTTPATGALMNLMVLTNFDISLTPQTLPFANLLLNPTKFDAQVVVKNLIAPTVINTKEGNPPPETGTFTWNFTDKKWDYNQAPSDKLVYIFPSNEEQTTNDAVLKISDITEVSQNNESFPTSALISLTIDEKDAMQVNYAATLSNKGLEDLGIDITMGTFQLGANLLATSTSNSVKVTVSHSIKKQNVSISSSNVELVVEGITSINPFTMDDMDDELIPKTIKGYLQMGEVKAQIDCAVTAYLAATINATDPNIAVSAANEHLKIDFYTYPNRAKMGIVVWEWDVAEREITPFFEYNNGTKEELDKAFDFSIDFDF